MSDYTQGVIILVCVNAVAVLGVSILTGFTRLFSFGNAGFMAIGAYASAILTKQYGWPLACSMPAAMLLAGIAAYCIGRLTLRLKGDYFLITTLGFGECIRVALDYAYKYTGGPRGYSNIPHYTNVYLAVAILIVATIVARNFIRSKYGWHLMAIREQEVAAEAVGVDTAKYKLLSFVMSALYAGCAGVLFAHFLRFINPTMFNLDKSSEWVITVVIGGLGSLSGSLIASAILTLLPEIFRSLAEYRMLLYGIAVVFIIMLRPNGLMGYREISSYFPWKPRTQTTAEARK